MNEKSDERVDFNDDLGRLLTLALRAFGCQPSERTWIEVSIGGGQSSIKLNTHSLVALGDTLAKAGR